MDAELLVKRRVIIADATFAELVIWRVPRPLAGSKHAFKYRLALVHQAICVLRYDNEAGKGDHIHRSTREYDYRFTDVDALVKDFWDDVENWINEHSNTQSG